MDLRFSLLTYLLVGFVTLLAALALAMTLSLRDDVQEEMRASARLVKLLLRAGEVAPQGHEAAHQVIDPLLAEGGLRHVKVAWERSGTEQLSQSATSAATDEPWFARLSGLEGLDFPEYRLSAGPGEQLVIRMDPRSEFDEVLEDAARMLAVFVLFAGVSMAAAWWAADRALRPVRALEEGLARIGRSEWDRPLPPMALREYQRVALAINQLAQSLAQAKDGERRLGQRLMVMQETEREELARELHDEFGQGLAAMGAAAAFVERHAESAQVDTLVECARDIRQASARMSCQVRNRLRQLRPHGLQEFNLREAISELLHGSRLKAEGVSIETLLPDALPRLSHQGGLALYRTVQEALTNVLRHARATRVRLEICAQAQGLQLTLDDDGVGRAHDVQRNAGAGVMGMRERAVMAGGRFELGTAPLGGLRVRLWLPLFSPEQPGEIDDKRAVTG